jgi:hypothetical protein
MSGVASSYLQVNAAPAGGTSGEWISLKGTPGPGLQREASIDGTPAGQGLHAVRLITFDAAGNAAVATAPSPVLIDTIAPELRLDSLPDAPVRDARIAYTVHDDQEDRSGLGPVEIDVNTAADGTEKGAWQRVSEHAVGSGASSEIVSLGAFASGRHRLRVRAHNAGAAGATLAAEQSGEVVVDSTTPTLANVRFQAAASRELTVSWIADDAGAGVVAAAAQWLDRGQWTTVAAAAVGAGPGSLVVPADRLPPGSQRMRLVVLDAAGNAAVQTQPESGSRVDQAPPAIADLQLGAAPPAVSWTQTDVDGGFGECPTTVAVNLREGGPWRTLVSLRLGEGGQTVALPVGDLPAGVYRTRVTACDAAGNQASAEIGGLTVTGRAGGAARPAEDPQRYRGARIEVRASVGAPGPGFRVVDAGQSLILDGRLRDRRNQPLAGTRIEAREGRGRSLGQTLTDRAGGFRLRIRPATGPVSVGVPVGGRLLPARGGLVRVRVRPRLTLTSSARVATSGGPAVEFRGRFEPSPQRLGVGAGKRIDLHYRHPVTGDWQLVKTAQLAADGTFSIPWTFSSRGYTFRLRATVTAELGWPFAPTGSGTVAVTVRP